MSSISGFRKIDLYERIESLILKAKLTNETISLCCSMFAELSLTKNELIKLVSFSIDIYSRCVQTKNLWIIHSFSTTCEQLLPYHTMSVSQKGNDHSFHVLISNLVMILLLNSKNDRINKNDDDSESILRDINHISFLKEKIQNNPTKSLHTKELTSGYEYNDRILLKFSKYFPNVDGCISDFLFRKICTLLYCSKKERDVSNMILVELFDQSVSSTIPNLNVEAFIFPELHQLGRIGTNYKKDDPKKTSDIFWLIWLGIIKYTKKHDIESFPYIYELFNLSQIEYNKKNRHLRLNLLLYVFLYIIPGKCIFEPKEKDQDIFDKISSKIPVIFNDIYTSTGIRRIRSAEKERGNMYHSDKDKCKNENILGEDESMMGEGKGDERKNVEEGDVYHEVASSKDKNRSKNKKSNRKVMKKQTIGIYDSCSEKSSEGIPDYMNIIPFI